MTILKTNIQNLMRYRAVLTDLNIALLDRFILAGEPADKREGVKAFVLLVHNRIGLINAEIKRLMTLEDPSLDRVPSNATARAQFIPGRPL